MGRLWRDSHEITEGPPPYPREWAGRVAVGEGPEAGLFGEPTWAGAINRDSGNRPRSRAQAQPGHGFYRSATFPKGLRAVVGAGDCGKAPAGVACDSHTVPSAAAGIDDSRVEGWPGTLPASHLCRTGCSF